MPLDIVVAGLNVVDVLFKLPTQFRVGDKHEVAEVQIQGGAPAGNAACVLGSLGKSVGFVAKMGRNTLSEIARSELRRNHVSEELIIDEPAAMPAVAVVQIDEATGERTVFYALNGYARLAAADVPESAVRNAKLVLVDGYEMPAALRTLELAAGKCDSVIDLEAGDGPDQRKMLSLAGHAVLPAAAARLITGETDPETVLKSLAKLCPGQCVITDGAKGSWANTPEGVIHQKSFPTTVVDTTGCGDAFHGAYAAGVVNRWPLPQRLEFASYVAAHVARTLGGRFALPTPDSLRNADLSMLSANLRNQLQS